MDYSRAAEEAEAETELDLSIDEQEIMLQSFAMDHPDVMPTEDDFTKKDFLLARDVVSFTGVIDKELNVEVLEEGAKVSRDVLATYKTLLYRTAVNGERVRIELRAYKQIALVLGIGCAVLLGIHWFGGK